MRSRLEALKSTDATLIFFESPRRLAETLAAMAEMFGGDRQAVVARELTKTFEELRRGTLDELAAHYREAATPKGEIVICVAPPAAQARAAPEDVDRLLLSLAGEMPASKAAAEAARMTGRPKPELYRRLLELKDRAGGWLTQAGRRHKAYRRGHRSEWLAALALMLKGYRIVARRYRTKLGEIDLIARRGDLV